MHAEHLPHATNDRKIIGLLALTQVISWGTLYYAFSVLAPDMQRELGWRAEPLFGAFSWSLLIAGLIATPAGILLDRHGGRPVMGLGSLIAGLGLFLLSQVQSMGSYFVAWGVIGIAMAMVLYEAAFATINREFDTGARKGISTLTLFGGLASTVFWPVTLHLNGEVGWRDTYLFYAALHMVLCMPAHLLLSNRGKRLPKAVAAAGKRSHTLSEAVRHPMFWKLALAFATNAFIFSALSVHLIPLVQRLGHAAGTAVFFATLIGPMQVVGRIGEMVFAGRTQPQSVGKITFALLPTALGTLVLLGQHEWVVALFCMLYGLSNGILTIVKGTVPQELFGRENYGAISGALAGPALVAKAAGPLAMAAMLEGVETVHHALLILLAAAIASFLFYLAAVRRPARQNSTEAILEEQA
ncbi:MFS transporter [Noviherbaspirillum galbum]|uniref:MFS transporter n=1 Tax=Noviherbaspirillum galbum TaxID=2709383 RepID=A0A6B3SRG0_9BURK|nr:MFS transporter [Noviherbaspirillum galbum]NEX63333.1 MFS transporter [Noviherbaspirillum galbum]